MPTIQKTLQIFGFIQVHIRDHGYAPTNSEIGRVFRMRSSASVHGHLCKLERMGLIKRGRHWRGIEIVARSDMKLCSDKECPRSGIRLKASEFPKNRNRPDGLNPYCKECSLRRVHQHREKRRAAKRVEREARLKAEAEKEQELANAPAIPPDEQVKLAVERGAKTIEAIQKETHMDYDSLGELLAKLVWQKKSLRIVRLPRGREFRVAA